MSRCRFTFVLFLCTPLVGELRAASPVVVDDTPITVPSFGPRFQEIHERIDALYQYRDGKHSLPEVQFNLFRLAVDQVVAPVEPTPVEAPVDSETILRQAVATVRGGIIKTSSGTAAFVSNGKSYREGDTIAARYREKSVLLTIKQVTATSVKFGLENAEVVVMANQL